MDIQGLKRKFAHQFLADLEHGQEALTKNRLEVCEECEHYKKETKQCGVCGCFVDIKATLATNRNPKKLGRIEVTHCPKGRWPAVDVDREGKTVSVVPTGGTDYRLANYYK